MENELFKRIKDYKDDGFIRFHMPGHKGRSDILKEAYEIDITEIDFSDNLNYPSEIIKEYEDYTAKVFNTYHTIFTVNGSSAALMAAIMYYVKEGEKLLLPYNSHISCYYGAMHALCGIIRCEVKDNVKGISIDDIKNALENQTDIKACVITSPTYFGIGSDIKGIVEYLHEKHIAVIADESHGAHFALSENYPMSAVEAGADIVIHSLHKTIGAMTQTAMIHINNENIIPEDIRFYLRSVQSTSPSYVLICSVFEAVRNLKNSIQVLENVRIWYNNISEIISKLDNIDLVNDLDYFTDYMKVCVSIKGDAKFALEYIKENYRIIPEMLYEDKIVFMAGLKSEKSDFDILAKALIDCDKLLSGEKQKYSVKIPKTDSVYSIAKALDKKSEYVPLDEGRGRISASFVNVYPPGAPCLIPGEVITEEIIKFINSSDNVEGLYNNKIKAVK